MDSELWAAGPASEAMKLSKTGIAITVLAAFLSGIALGAVWFCCFRASTVTAGGGQGGGATVAALQENTRAILRELDSPIELRFYCLLDRSTVPAAEQAFAERVSQLLSQYQQESAGKITLTYYNSQTNFNTKAADADGIMAFNRDKGNACYLGIAVAGKLQKESLPHLAAQWEPALEFDLSRAIARVAQARPAGQPMARVDAAAVEAVKHSIPNLEAVSLEEGTQVLRGAALAQFQEAARELNAELKAAEQRFVLAQNDPSEAKKQDALRQLRQIQARQSDQLKEIAARFQAQSVALRQLKATP